MNILKEELNSFFKIELMIPVSISKFSWKSGKENIGIEFGFPLEILSYAVFKTEIPPLDPSEVDNKNIGLLYQTIFSILDIQSKIFLNAAD
mgnify:CR=1 FL=1